VLKKSLQTIKISDKSVLGTKLVCCGGNDARNLGQMKLCKYVFIIQSLSHKKY